MSTGYTDLRKGIDGYAHIVQDEYHLDPFSKSIYLFCNGQRDKIKILYWDKNGFWLLYKRLEKGHFKWKRNEETGTIIISEEQFRWLMEGLKIDQKTAFKPVNAKYV